jgi:hypothetical protein
MGILEDIQGAKIALSGEGLRSRTDTAEARALGLPKKKKKKKKVVAAPAPVAPAAPNAANELEARNSASFAASEATRRESEYAAGQAALAARKANRQKGLRR